MTPATTPTTAAAYKSSVETKDTEKFGAGAGVKLVSGISFFGIAGTQMTAEVKATYNWGGAEASAETTAYSAAPSGQVSVKPTVDGAPGNCSVIEVYVEKVKASGTLGVVATIPADAVIRVAYKDYNM